MNIRLSEKERIRVTDPDDIYGIMQRILERENRIDKEKEHLWIVGLNNGGLILYIELVALGTVRKIPVEPMNVFRIAVMKGASQIIMVHNHPSGNLSPSAGDLDITDQLMQVGNILGITLSDHLIITPAYYLSFSFAGIMKELKESLKYVPTYQLIEKVKKEERKIRRELIKENKEKIKAKDEKLKAKDEQIKLSQEETRLKERQLEEYKIITIKNLLQRPMPMEEIAEIMGIPVEEVQRLIDSL